MSVETRHADIAGRYGMPAVLINLDVVEWNIAQAIRDGDDKSSHGSGAIATLTGSTDSPYNRCTTSIFYNISNLSTLQPVEGHRQGFELKLTAFNGLRFA